MIPTAPLIGQDDTIPPIIDITPTHLTRMAQGDLFAWAHATYGEGSPQANDAANKYAALFNRYHEMRRQYMIVWRDASAVVDLQQRESALIAMRALEPQIREAQFEARRFYDAMKARSAVSSGFLAEIANRARVAMDYVGAGVASAAEFLADLSKHVEGGLKLLPVILGLGVGLILLSYMPKPRRAG